MPADQAGYPSVAVVILTAGRGTRMRSELPKVLHPLAGLPMVEHVVRAAREVRSGQIILTIGPTSEALRDTIDGVDFAWQAEALGTGDAVRVALPRLHPGIEWVTVIFGDHPLMDAGTLATLIECTLSEQPLLASVAVSLPDPGPYGRYRYNSQGRVTGIVEAHEDAQSYSGPVRVNSGACCIRVEWLRESIEKLNLSPKGEYYLTELVEIAARSAAPNGREPVIIVDAHPAVALGINDRVELAQAERLIRQRINERHMRAGVTMVDPATTYIDAEVQIGADTRIEPGCILRGRTSIGRGCKLGPSSVIEDSMIGDYVAVLHSWVEMSEVRSGTRIGPYSHLRPSTLLEPGVHIGNYVELKNAHVGSGTHIGHVSYVGDAELGERVNVGAGTITCNFDGANKHRTTVGDDVFIGSDTMLVAPVELGDGARTGAGSVVTRPVEPGQLVVGIPARPIRRSTTPAPDGAGHEHE